jgi:hypothetical protein
MYSLYTQKLGWTYPKVISDGYMGVFWNDGTAENPRIAIGTNNDIHVVWTDYMDGEWGSDSEIFYVRYDPDSGWSNITVISDLQNYVSWNDGDSYIPSISVDNQGGIHITWHDYTNGPWGTDAEIMYSVYDPLWGWSYPIVISDLYNNIEWNYGVSYNPDIDIDNKNGYIYVSWHDSSFGIWGTDSEIMFVYSSFQIEEKIIDKTPSSASISFGFTFIPFMMLGLLSMIIVVKQKKL